MLLARAAARRSSVEAGISPLWLLAPFGGLFFTSPLGFDVTGLGFVDAFLTRMPSTIWQVVQAAFLIAQAALSVYIGRRHRAWPWLAWPLTIVLGLLAAAIVVTDLAMVAGPMVK